MRRVPYIFLVFSLGAALLWSGCDALSASDDPVELDPKTTAQLDRSVANWNRMFAGSGVALDGWELGSKITPENRERVARRLTEPENVWLPDGDISAPQQIRAVQLSDAAAPNSSEVRKLLGRIEDEVVFGRYLAELRWSQGGESFSTTAILDEDAFVEGLDSVAIAGRPDSLDDDGLVYDPMLSNVFQLREEVVVVDTAAGLSAERLYFGWIWEEEDSFTLGHATAAVFAGCFLGNVLSCDHECSLALTRFDRKAVNQFVIDGPDDDGCSLSYVQGVSTGLRTMRLSGDSTSVIAEGGPGMFWGRDGLDHMDCSEGS